MRNAMALGVEQGALNREESRDLYGKCAVTPLYYRRYSPTRRNKLRVESISSVFVFECYNGRPFLGGRCAHMCRLVTDRAAQGVIRGERPNRPDRAEAGFATPFSRLRF